MATRALRPEEIAGLVLAALGHAGLVWVLVNARPPEPLPPLERVSVTLSEETGPVSTSPDPAANPEADQGPVLGEPAPEPEVVPQAKPEPVPQPKASAPPPPRPAPSQAAKAPPPKAPPAKTAAAPKAPPAKAPPPRAGASNFNEAFGSGIPGGTGKAKNPPAAQASAQQKSSWTNLVGNRIRGPWDRCTVTGLDVDKLRATVRFTLSPTGQVLSIDPPVVTGITDANRAQVEPFKSCAVRAIKLAAPYTGLPPEFYDAWKVRNPTFRKGQ